MAKYVFNNGKLKDLTIPNKLESTKIFLTAEIIPDNNIISKFHAFPETQHT